MNHNYSEAIKHIKYVIKNILIIQGLFRRGMNISSDNEEINDCIKNSLIETWVIQLRNICDFLYPDQKNKDRIHAFQFFDVSKRWTNLRLAKSSDLEESLNKANDLSAHLTWNREESLNKNSVWNMDTLTSEIIANLMNFLESMKDLKLRSSNMPSDIKFFSIIEDDSHCGTWTLLDN